MIYLKNSLHLNFGSAHNVKLSRSAVREAYQSRIGQRILNSNPLVHLNPNFRESELRTYTYFKNHINGSHNQRSGSCNSIPSSFMQAAAKPSYNLVAAKLCI